MLAQLTCPRSQLHPPPPPPQSPGVQDCWVSLLCANFTTFGSVTIQRDLPRAGHTLFPGVLELSAEFWLLLMALCGCLGSVIPVWLLMTASPTRPSHLFVLAASPPLYASFSEREEIVATSLHQYRLHCPQRKHCPQSCSDFCTWQTPVRTGLQGRNTSTRDSDLPGLFAFTPFRNCMPMANPPGCPANCQRDARSADSVPASWAQEVVTRVPQPWGVSLLRFLILRCKVF